MAWVTGPSNITISTLGGSATSVATTNNDYTRNAVHKLEWVCSYSSSGVLTMSMYFTVTGSWGKCYTRNSRVSATVNGSTYTFLSPGTVFDATTMNDRMKMGGDGTWTIKDTTSIPVSLDIDMWCGSDTGDQKGYGPSPRGGMTGSFTITVPRVSDITNPVAGTTSASYSEDGFRITWSGFQAGTNNPIASYELWYRESTNNSSWGERVRIQNGASTPYNWDGGTFGRYYQFCAVAIGQNSGHSSTSAWSNSVRKYATVCSAPSNVYINSNTDSAQYVNPGSAVRLYWSGAAGGTNNSIQRYYIQRRKNGGAWGAASDHNASSGNSQSLDNTEGAYFEFQVRTEGAAGSSYYSGYKLSRNRVYNRSKPTVGTPTVSVSADKSKLVIEWESGGGTGNAIAKQEVYARSRSTATGTWSGYTRIATDPTRPFIWSGGNPGYYYQFYVVVTGEHYSSAQSSVSAQIQYPVSAVGNASQLSVTAGEKRVGQPWTLTWRAGSAGINNPVKQHRVYYRRSDGSRELIATLSAGTTTYSGTWPDVNVVALEVQEVGTVSGYDSGYASISVSISPPTYIYLKTASGLQKIRPYGIKSVWIKEASGVTMLWTK